MQAAFGCAVSHRDIANGVAATVEPYPGGRFAVTVFDTDARERVGSIVWVTWNKANAYAMQSVGMTDEPEPEVSASIVAAVAPVVAPVDEYVRDTSNDEAAWKALEGQSFRCARGLYWPAGHYFSGPSAADVRSLEKLATKAGSPMPFLDTPGASFYNEHSVKSSKEQKAWFAAHPITTRPYRGTLKLGDDASAKKAAQQRWERIEKRAGELGLTLAFRGTR